MVLGAVRSVEAIAPVAFPAHEQLHCWRSVLRGCMGSYFSSGHREVAYPGHARKAARRGGTAPYHLAEGWTWRAIPRTRLRPGASFPRKRLRNGCIQTRHALKHV